MAQHPKRIEHMARRRAQGLTHRELGEEFGMSRRHAGRLLNGRNPDNHDYGEGEDVSKMDGD